jgi:hypothetical protein
MLDTSPEAARAQAEAYRRLRSSRRFEIACELSQAVRRLALDRIHRKRPDLDESATRELLVWELYGIRRPTC